MGTHVKLNNIFNISSLGSVECLETSYKYGLVSANLFALSVSSAHVKLVALFLCYNINQVVFAFLALYIQMNIKIVLYNEKIS